MKMFLKINDFPHENVQRLHKSLHVRLLSAQIFLSAQISLSVQAFGVPKNTNVTIQTVFRDVSDNIAAAISCVTCRCDRGDDEQRLCSWMRRPRMKTTASTRATKSLSVSWRRRPSYRRRRSWSENGGPRWRRGVARTPSDAWRHTSRRPAPTPRGSTPRVMRSVW